jgi:uncharacterized Zn finger protein
MTRAKDRAGPPRFDVAMLRRGAGEAVFARGAAYFSDGRVRLTSIDADAMRADVSGSQVYRASLTGNGRDLFTRAVSR